MDEKEKPFDTVSIVILVLLALGNDGAEIFFDLLAATVVGLPGEAIMEPINLGMDGIFTFWFFAKCGFGGPAMIQIADDVLSLVGIPGRTICVVAGILIANNPKLAAVAEIAGAAALTGGAGAVAAEAGETAEVGAVAAESATAGTAAGAEVAKAETTVVETGTGGTTKTIEEAEKDQAPQEEGGGEEAEQKKEELEKEMETEEERSPEEVAQEKIFEEVSRGEEDQNEEEESEDINEPVERNAQSSGAIPIDGGGKAHEIRQQQQKPHAPKIIDLSEEDKAA